jgi:predicted AAA+ superfamily ATPase
MEQFSIGRQALLDALEIRLRESPAVALLGARQVGKTTLARHLAQRWGEQHWFDLERPAALRALQATPELTLSQARGLVVIDEAQRLPEIFPLLRPLCDDPARTQTFLLLGSASPDLIRSSSESLAGRLQTIPVPGFSLDELGPDAHDRLWLRGGFPRATLATSDAAAERWLEGFRQTFLERDIPNLGIRVPAAALGRFWSMLAHYHGQVWNAAELGRSMGVSPATANHYRDLLAGTYMLRVLPPWHENLGKRQVKSPKVYLRDSGLLHYLLGIPSMAGLREHPRYGASFEGFALEQILIRHGERDAYFWATQRGAELDLLLLRGQRRYGFEIKCQDAPAMTKSMHIALADLHLDHLWVVHPGQATYALHSQVTAVGLRDLPELGHD